MCNFVSALVLRNGDVLTHPMLDSHVDLVSHFKLPDHSEYIQNFVKVELVPGADAWLTPEKWKWTVDESSPPAWWPDVASAAEGTLRARVRSWIMTSGQASLATEDVRILGGTAVLDKVSAGRVIHMSGNGQVHDVYGSGQVHRVLGDGQVHDVYGNGKVHYVYGSGQVHRVFGDGQVHDVYGNGKVHRVYDSGQVHRVFGDGQVHDVYGNGKVHRHA